MFNLLSWLYDQASRVYAIFGYLYGQVRDAALNAYRWARDAANDAYQWARNTTLYYYERAKDRIAEALQTAWNTTRYYYDLLSDTISTLYGWVIDRILYWYNRAVQGAQGLVQGVVDLTHALFNQAIRNAENLFNSAVVLFQAIADRIAFEINRRIDQSETAIHDLREMLNVNNAEGVNNLVTIFRNPIGWIFSLLYINFIEFLTYQLARGLGTVKYELPPPPTFGLSSGGPYPGPIPIPGNGVLTAPLGSLYVSGYTFNHPAGHKGVDFGLANGDPVYACHDGEVQVAGWSTVGYGYQVVLQGGDYWSRYGHCLAVNVAPGQRVDAGQIIGQGDSTGNSTGPHLHLEIKRKGVFIDPLSVL